MIKAAELGFCCVVVLLQSKEIHEHLSKVKMLPSYCTILVEDIRHCQQTVIRLSIHTVRLKIFCSCCKLADMATKSYMNVAWVSNFFSTLFFCGIYKKRKELKFYYKEKLIFFYFARYMGGGGLVGFKPQCPGTTRGAGTTGVSLKPQGETDLDHTQL